MDINKHFLMPIIIITLFASCSGVFAQTDNDARIDALEQKVKQLEELLQRTGIDNPGEPAGQGEPEPNIGENITLSGAIEVEAAIESDKLRSSGKYTSSDIALATVELGFDAEISEKFAGNITLLWEEDDTDPFDIDQGIITYQGRNYDITAGRFYPPFGNFSSHFINDPLTVELGEIQESGVMIHTAPSDLFEASLSLANGDLDKTSANDNVSDLCLRIDFHPIAEEAEALDMGFQYYSDIADTGSELLGPGVTGAVQQSIVGGLGVFVDWFSGRTDVNFEYLGALKSFDTAALNANNDGSGDKPVTWNIEIGYELSDTLGIALKYEGSDDLADLPESQFGIVSNWALRENVSFALEYLHGTFNEDLSNTKNRHLLMSQLAVEF